MNVEEYIRIYRAGGHKIITLCSYYFQPRGLRNYSFPLDHEIMVTDKMINSLKWKYLITIICTKSLKKNAYEHLLQTDRYDLVGFDHKVRNRIKKSLQNCLFKRPSIEDMLDFGLKINRQTLKIQKRKDKPLTDIKLWNNYLQSLYAREDTEILGAYFNNRMVGYLVVLQIEGKYCLVNAFIDRKDSEVTCPMNGLIYTIVNHLIKKNRSINISYGLETFNNPRPELSRFKRQMLFKPVPATRVFVINPVVLIVFKLIILFNIKVLKQRRVTSPFTKKIIMLYQGHRILADELKRARLSK